MNYRPIMLYGYEVRSTLSYPFTIKLVPIESEDDRREWNFKCDTSEEVHHWFQALVNASKTISVVSMDMSSR